MRPSFAALLIAFVLLLASCKDKEQPLNTQEALAFAKKIDSAVANKDFQFFATFLDQEAFAKKVADQGSGESVKSIKQGLKRGMQRSDLGRQIIAETRKGGKYELVKHYEKKREPSPPFPPLPRWSELSRL